MMWHMLRREFLAQLALLARAGQLNSIGSVFDNATKSSEVAAAVLAVRQRTTWKMWTHGSAGAKTPFLLASITKPMTATAVMKLTERGDVSLSDPVQKFIPQFSGGDRGLVTVRHLLTHTSGLPDMLPENDDLRRHHAPLSDFVAATCKTPLLYKPGTECRYQSMGILLAAEIAERITKTPLRDFLREQVFRPLGMNATSLGLGGRRIEDTARCQVTADEGWNWNSPYWRDLGSPWGGAHATAGDVITFLESFRRNDNPVLKPETMRLMLTDQNTGLNQPWGIGWSVNTRPAKEPRFAKYCGPATFGHSGSTGTASWCDPATQTSFALLTSKPAAESGKTVIRPIGDAVSEVVRKG
jgi:CubicO group peptidase (beta-lactamase class C family)